MARYYLQGGGGVDLSRSDFKAQGGQGSIYVKGSTAYKVYADPNRMISPAKIGELAVLNHPSVIRPEQILLDSKKRPVGYSMRHIDTAYALCQVFPKSFRLRNNFTPDAAFSLVRALQEGIRHVHSKQILIVDLNEMNFLVSEQFKELFFIDVDSYQTASFPATALMESVRDRHATTFNEGTDWFAFAVVSFQVFVGIHPYKGTYQAFQGIVDKAERLDSRMRANISVLHNGVTVPATCLPFDVIPAVYLDWYRAVLEEGKRIAPPDAARPQMMLHTPALLRHVGSDHFDIAELYEFDEEVVWFRDNVIVTEQGVYVRGRRFGTIAGEKIAITPRLGHVIGAVRDGDRIRFRDLTTGSELSAEVIGEELMAYDGRLYVKNGAVLAEVEFVELPATVLVQLRPVGNVLMKATQMFEGAAIQNLLGAFYASLLPRSGVCYQSRLGELDGYRIVDARLSRNVLFVVASRNGIYDKFIFRFDAEFRSYDVRVARDVPWLGINFTTLETDLCLHLNESDQLEIFSAKKGPSSFRVIVDPAIGGDAKLFHLGKQALFARGKKLYRFSMRQ